MVHAPYFFFLGGGRGGHFKQHLGSRRFHGNEEVEVEVAIHECLRLQNSYCYGDGIFEVVPRWDIYSYSNVLCYYVER